ncbi:MAG: integrase [Candidatus Hydrothermota bacterium]|nr:MAG: integrase [Candidatus Hydrothermae bacterium]
MVEQVLQDKKTRGRYRGKTFSGEIDLYLDWMQRNGYAKNTICKRVFLLSSFSDYLASQDIEMIEAIPAHASAFVCSWVHKSKRQKRTKDPRRLAKEISCHIEQFLRFLENIGKLKPPNPAPDLDPSLQGILTGFVGFCRVECGLAEATIRLYAVYVRKFLLSVQTTGAFLCSQWNCQMLYDYLKKEGATTGRRGMNCVCSALRSLFRFLQIRGQFLAPGLDNFPRPRIYTQESLPRFLYADQVQQVLKSVDRTTQRGIRDYAILMLLIVYGMRASEVVRLRLDDLDWAGGKIHLKNRKTRRSDVFPLSVPAGEAVVEYLQEVRPLTGLRRVFLSLYAPIRPFRSGGTVSTIVRKYLLTSGVPLPDRAGAHLFRHTFAHQLLALGMPYKFIGDFLGHSSASSTSVYLKVDIDRLRQVALNDGEDLL